MNLAPLQSVPRRVMNLAPMLPPSGIHAPRAWIPGYAIRVALAVVGMLLCLVAYGPTGWLAIAGALALAAAWSPSNLLGWVLIVFLAGGQLTRHPSLSWQFPVLLAGLHLLHVLCLLALEVPWRGWIAPAAFVAPLRRFLAIQVPAQLLAVVALLVLSPTRAGHRPLTVTASVVVGAAAAILLALMLLGPRAAGESDDLGQS